MWWIPQVFAAELAPGVEQRTVTHEGHAFLVVTVDLRKADLALVGLPGGPHTVEALEKTQGPAKGWVVATNASLYHSVDRPVGLFVAGGVEHAPLNLGSGQGNFWLLPNGVFTLDAQGARVVESHAYKASAPIKLATQSGPALLLGGAVHPRFQPNSTSLNIRNAVGVSDPQTVHLVLSLEPVRFHTLATLFRDALRCTDALYLDGTISGMWAAPSLGAVLPPSPREIAYAGFLVVIPRGG